MASQQIGYARVSTGDQDPSMQVDALRAAGVDRVFVDVGTSSRVRDRPEWLVCLSHMRAGDVLLVYRLDRIAGSTGMLIETMHELGERGVDVRSLTEPTIDTTSPMGKALYGMVALFAQLRIDTIRQNTIDGLARARREGRVGGRPSVITSDRIFAAHDLHARNQSNRTIARTLGVSEATVRRMLARPLET